MMLAVLVVARLALGFTFQSAGSAAPYLATSLDANLRDAGILIGLFMVPGIVLALPTGALGARFGDTRMVLVGFALMAAGSFASGWSDTWFGVVIGRVVTGVGAVPLLILMTKMAFDWFAGTREFFVAMSLFIIGWPVGHALGQSVLTAAGQYGGWPRSFQGAGIACLFAMLLLALAYRPPVGVAQRGQASLSSLTQREFRLTTIAGLLWMVNNGAYVLVLGFGPAVLWERGVDTVAAANVASLFPWACLISLPLGAWVATRWQAPNVVMVGSLAGAAVLGAWLAFEPQTWLFLAVGIAGAFGIATMAALPSEVLREDRRSVGLGWYYVWYFVGSAMFPALGGWVSETSGTAASAIAMMAIASAACLVLLGIFRVQQRTA
jgi:MFS family permease